MSDRRTHPADLGPPGAEKVLLPGTDKPLLITRFTPRFERWSEALHGPKPIRRNDRGELVTDDWNGKPFLRVDGEAKFAELAIARAFQKHGWDAVWVHSPSAGGYTRDYPLEKGRVSTLPENATRAMAAYTSIAGGAGCPDVFTWDGDEFMFVEAKQQDEGYTADQKRWMAALVNANVPPEELGRRIAVVRWAPRRARTHGT